MCPQTQFQYKTQHKLKDGRRIIHDNTNQNKAGVVMLISDKAEGDSYEGEQRLLK